MAFHTFDALASMVMDVSATRSFFILVFLMNK
jgi:hypothetical protein